MQDPNWIDVCGKKEDYLIAETRCHGSIAAASIIRRRALLRHSRYFLSGGPLFKTVEGLRAHLTALEGSLFGEALWVSVSPYVPLAESREIRKLFQGMGLSPAVREGRYSSTVTIDLRQPLRDIEAAFRPGVRRQLRKSAKIGISVVPVASRNGLDAFSAPYNALARRRGLLTLEEGYLARLYDYFMVGESAGRIFLAELNGEILAGLLLVPNRDRLIYERGFSSQKPEHRGFPLSHALHWEAIKWAEEQKFTTYDFGGYWDGPGDADPINRFKTGFSKHVQQLLPEYGKTDAPTLNRIADVAGAVLRWTRRATEK